MIIDIWKYENDFYVMILAPKVRQHDMGIYVCTYTHTVACQYYIFTLEQSEQ